MSLGVLIKMYLIDFKESKCMFTQRTVEALNIFKYKDLFFLLIENCINKDDFFSILKKPNVKIPDGGLFELETSLSVWIYFSELKFVKN